MNEPIPFQHVPVLANEALTDLALFDGAVAADVTAGGGGHLRLIANAVGQNGRVIAVDRDVRAHQSDAAGGVAKEFAATVKLFHASFSELPNILQDEGISGLDALMCDLGVSSPQLDDAARGFSFQREGPLDMRMDTTKGQSAYELIQSCSERELADLIFEFGDERFSRNIAKAIKDAWPIPNSTLALADVIAKRVGRREKIHPATRTFQALRIAVNRELEELDQLLQNIPLLLNKGGRAVFISFHSLEDRKVKNAFRELGKRTDGVKSWNVLHKKPVLASDEEVRINPRARSAKMRSIERLKVEDIK